MHHRNVTAGDVVLIRARVRKVYAESGIATVRTVTAGSEGGVGFDQLVVSLKAIERVSAEPADERLVPRKSW